jgi:hypothetical protein
MPFFLSWHQGLAFLRVTGKIAVFFITLTPHDGRHMSCVGGHEQVVEHVHGVLLLGSLESD